MENGVTWSADHGTRTVDLSETLIRVGIVGRTEIRLTPPNYVNQVSGSGPTSSFGDLSVGLKEQIGPLAGAFDLSVIVGSDIPLDAGEPSRHSFFPFVKFRGHTSFRVAGPLGACSQSSMAPTKYPVS